MSGKPVYTSGKRARKKYCKGTGFIGPIDIDPQCDVCGRSVRIRKDGIAFKHYPLKRVDTSDKRHSKMIQETYGITGEQYEAILAEQAGVCFICEKPPRSKRLAVDHNHETGEVRGLLCRRCNHRLLGSANDGTEILWRAIDYLDNPPARRVLGEQG